MTEASDRLAQAYGASSRQELSERYAQWAATYDTDLTGDYLAPARVVEALDARVEPDTEIIDVGAGTGLVGELLAELGYSIIDAVDMSPEMLAEAERKGVYRALYEGVLGERLPLGTDAYGAATAAGVFTQGHAPADGLEEVVRVVQSGGVVVFSLRPSLLVEGDFGTLIDRLTDDGRWRLEEVSERWQTLPRSAPAALLQTFVFRIL